MKLINYLRPTFEGRDGKASMKRLTVFLFVGLFMIAFFGDFFFNFTVSETILELIATIIVVGVLGNSAQGVASEYINKKSDETNVN